MKIYRKIIGAIDMAIIWLLSLRFRIALKIEKDKRKLGLPVRALEIEKRKIESIKKLSLRKKLDPLFMERLFVDIIDESVRLQEEQRNNN